MQRANPTPGNNIQFQNVLHRDDDPARGYIISTILFVSGIVTLLQATFGCRLPIIQVSIPCNCYMWIISGIGSLFLRRCFT